MTAAGASFADETPLFHFHRGGTTILVKINFKEFIYVVRHTGAYRFGG